MPRLAFLLVLALVAQPASAQFGVPKSPPPAAEEALSVYAFTPRHQPAAEALALVQPLLSARGGVEMRSTSLIVRDTADVIARLKLVLERFDHPRVDVRFEIFVVRATRASFSPLLPGDPLPAALAARLKDQMPYSQYTVLSRTELSALEGSEVTYRFGEGYGIRFRTGTILNGKHLKLQGFRFERGDGGAQKSLFTGVLHLQLGNTFAMSLSSEESSASALVLVMVPRVESGKR